MHKAKRKVTTRQKTLDQRKTAMPEVQRLVKRFGRLTVSSCLNKIRDVEKQASRIASMKKEIAVLRRKLK